MFTPPASILRDAYKFSHIAQFPEGIEYVYSTWIPRSTYIEGATHVVNFGLQAFIQEYLIEYFDDNFFHRPFEEVVLEYRNIMKAFFKVDDPDVSSISQLHQLGYLPIRIRALPEGTLVPLHVPMFTIENTDPHFAWLVGSFETLLSCEIWQPMTSATLSYMFRVLFDEWANKTTGSTEGVSFQGHDFSMRGMAGVKAASASGAGHLLSFVGSDTVPAMYYADTYYDADSQNNLIATSISACYDDQTELLTENGFKRFKDLDQYEQVAQYHSDGTIDFVIPSAYVDDFYEGDLVHFKMHRGKSYPDVDILVTPNHRMIRKNVKTGAISIFEAGSNADKGYSSNWRLPVSGVAVDGNLEFTMLDRLKVAFQADGSYPARAHAYNGERTGTFPIRFSISKERKKTRLRWILNSLEVEYTWEEYSNGYCSVRVMLPMRFSKTFDWINLSIISRQWAKSFVEELTHWDGSGRVGEADQGSMTPQFSSTDLFAIEQAQAVASCAGYKTYVATYEDNRIDYERKISYLVSFVEKSSIHSNWITKETVPYNGHVFCVSVPTGMLVVRRNNCVAICGNTEHSIMSAYGVDNEAEAYRHLIEDVYPEGFVSIVSDTYDLWNVITVILRNLKDSVMSRNGRLIVRPDTGDPVDIICGVPSDHSAYGRQDSSPEEKGVVELLWNTFGGTVTEQGYKVLDSHIGAIYGDSITYDRAKAIFGRLADKGFASTNITFGMGSYLFQYTTRDSFGFAMKSSWVKINGQERDIFKDPVTDKEKKKKSLTGRVAVLRPAHAHADSPSMFVKDGLSLSEYEEDYKHLDLLGDVFVDGKFVRRQSFDNIRSIVGKIS